MIIYGIVFLQILLIISITGCTNISEEVITGEEIANKFIEKQESIQDYSATATITTTQPVDTSKIKIMVKKPNKYKIETFQNSSAVIAGIAVTDGSNGVWIYSPEANFAIFENHSYNYDYGKSMIVYPYFYGRDYYLTAKNIMEKSNISYLGTESIGEHCTYVIEAIPEKPYSYNCYDRIKYVYKMHVWIDKKSWIIQKMVLFNEENNSLYKIESIDTVFNIGIHDAEFIFEPPEGVETEERLYISHSKEVPANRVLSTPTNESELISIVFPETWLMENDENEDPRIINVSFPALQLHKLRIDDKEYAYYLTPEEIMNDEKVSLLTMPKTMLISEMIKIQDQVKYANSE
jgi:outer membrane lipoprotein-sorting protein